MNPKELALSIARFLDSKKATDLEVIQIGELTTIGDYFVVASAGNTTLVKSLCEDLDEYLGRQGIEPKRIEGRSSAQWILMDYRDVIVHIFRNGKKNGSRPVRSTPKMTTPSPNTMRWWSSPIPPGRGCTWGTPVPILRWIS